jgi:hypothetical protein
VKERASFNLSREAGRLLANASAASQLFYTGKEGWNPKVSAASFNLSFAEKVERGRGPG